MSTSNTERGSMLPLNPSQLICTHFTVAAIAIATTYLDTQKLGDNLP